MTTEAKIRECREDNHKALSREAEQGICPDCGEDLVHQESCLLCLTCGFSACQ